jgi:hypothetical protein
MQHVQVKPALHSMEMEKWWLSLNLPLSKVLCGPRRIQYVSLFAISLIRSELETTDLKIEYYT